MKISRCFNILRITIIFSMCMGLFAYSSLYAQEEIDNQLNMLIHTGIDKVNKEEIDEALKTFQNIIDSDRESPIGYFYTAALYKALMQDYRTRTFNDKFYFYINKAIKKGEKLIKKDKNNDLAYFYLGGSYGYRAIHKSEKGKWFGAFVDAEKGVSCLEKALSINPQLYDAYYGLGVYKYWRSVKSQVLWFLPFFKDERQAGINEIQRAIARGNYSRIEAKGALITIYRNEELYDRALNLTDEILREYPESIYAIRTKGIILVELKRWDEATEIFARVLEQIEKGRQKGPGAKMEIEYYLTLIHYEQEKIYEHTHTKGIEKLAQLKERLKEEAENEILNEMLNKVAFSIKKDVRQSDTET